MNKSELNDRLVMEMQAETSACFSRFGTIVAIGESNVTVRVNFDGNPFKSPISARLGRSFRRSEIELAIDNKLSCRIDFINGDVSLPIVTDIFFSLLDDNDSLTLRAKRLVIEAEEELVIKSGETQTRLSGRDGRVTTKGKYVTSQAEKAQKIQGGTIAIN
ncbi:hypothetical protein [Vibrio maritimus]|uniref:hypothetical protein n=1 Tax=Vibrio maritimus TaxID=990268 RepID=UPI001F264907|nr:hypothetical protein [Vibrio maritimus]